MISQAPLFKGATRPACIWGIPMKPFCGCVGIFILLAFWVWIPFLFACPACLIVMHQIAKDDDQRFRQLFLCFRVNFLGGGNKAHWRSIASFSPVSYKTHRIKR